MAFLRVLGDALARLFGDPVDLARKATPLRTVREAREAGGGRVRVEGTITSAERMLVAPFSGASCVLWAASHAQELLVTETATRDEEEIRVWREQLRSGEAAAFEIADASGGRARIELPGGPFEARPDDPVRLHADAKLARALAEANADRQEDAVWHVKAGAPLEIVLGDLVVRLPFAPVSDTARIDAMPPELDAFLRARGVVPTPYMGLVRENRFLEARLAVGDRVEVIGDASEALVGAGEGYRGAHAIVRIAARSVVALR